MALQSTDPIADMLTRVRNAIMAGKREVTMPSTKLRHTIATQLKKSKYLIDVKVEKASPTDLLTLVINDEGTNPTINEIGRVSKPGRRVYAAASDIPRVKNGRGVMLVSTSKGVMTDQEARKARLGGELLLEVY